MKILTTGKMQVLAKSTSKSQDGTKDYYKLAVLQETECGNLSCNAEVYGRVEAGNTYNVEFAYNDQYKSMSIVGVSAPLK